MADIGDFGAAQAAQLGGLLLLIVSAIKILKEYERGVIFQLGKVWKVKGPGLIIVIPVIQQMVRVDLRTVVMDVPTQDVISRDNVSVQVNAVIYFRVVVNYVESGKIPSRKRLVGSFFIL